MGIIQANSRLQHHVLTNASTPFTVPASEDFTDGTWLITDLVLGEIGINLSNDTAYFRTSSGIIEIASIGSLPVSVWERSGDDIKAIKIGAEPNILPATDDVSDIGSPNLRWKDLYLGSVIDFAVDLEMKVAGTNMATFDINGLEVNGNLTVGTRTGAAGTNSFTQGNSVEASGDASHAGGISANASHHAEWARSGDSSGNTQYGIVSCTGRTSSATPTEIFLDGTTGSSGSDRFTIPINTAYRLTITALALIPTSTGAAKSWSGSGVVKNISGVTTLVSAITMSPNVGDGGLGIAAINVTASDPLDALIYTVTGIGGTQVYWTIKTEYLKISF